MAIVVGSVAVDVVPNATSFARDLRAQIEGPVDAVGQEVGQNLSDAVIEHLADAIPDGLAAGVPESASLGDEAGARYADAFSTQIRTKIDAALKSLPEANVNLGTTEAEAKLSDLRDQLAQLGYTDLDVNLTDDAALAKIEELRAELEEISLTAPDIRVRVDAADAQAKLASLLAQIYALDAAQQALAASMAADIEADKAMADAINLVDDIEAKMGQSMFNDIEKAKSGAEGASSSISGMGIALGGVALVAAPVLGSLIAGFADLVIGIKNAHIETGALQTAWGKLEQEAGTAIQPGIQAAVDGLTRAIPALEPLVDTLGADIGGALDKAAQWLGDGGAAKIVSYLQTEIPIVGGLFESLGSDVAGFIKLTQGPANQLLTILNQVAQVAGVVEKIGGIKVPGTGTSAYQIASDAANPIISPVENIVSILGKSSTSAPTSAVAHAVTAGSPTRGGSTVNVPAHLPPYVPQHADAIAAFQHATGSGGLQGPTLDSKSMQQATSGLDDNTQAYAKNAAAAKETVSAYLAAQVAAADFANQTAQNTANMSAENNAAGLLQQALTGFGSNVLGVAQSETAFHASITAVNTSLKTNGSTLNENTDAGQKNRAAIEASVAAAQQHAEAIATQTGNTKDATDAYNSDIAALKSQLAATGLSKQAIDNYVDSIDTIPPFKQTKLEIDTAQADAAIASLNSQLSTLGKRATGIEVTSEAVLRRAAAGADGMFLKFYADGGMENHVAQMASGDTVRIWGEPETEGESYIPHAASKRPRSEAILAQTANLFGGTYVPKGARNFADGMVLRGSSGGLGGSSGSSDHSHPISVLLDGRKITKVVNEQNGRNGRL